MVLERYGCLVNFLVLESQLLLLLFLLEELSVASYHVVFSELTSHLELVELFPLTIKKCLLLS